MRLLLWVNVMLDFICKGFVELYDEREGSKTIRNENICFQRDSDMQLSVILES